MNSALEVLETKKNVGYSMQFERRQEVCGGWPWCDGEAESLPSQLKQHFCLTTVNSIENEYAKIRKISTSKMDFKASFGGLDSGPRPAAPYGPYVPSAGVAPKAEVPKQNPMVQVLAIGFADFMVHTIPLLWWNVFSFFWCPAGFVIFWTNLW